MVPTSPFTGDDGPADNRRVLAVVLAGVGGELPVIGVATERVLLVDAEDRDPFGTDTEFGHYWTGWTTAVQSGHSA